MARNEFKVTSIFKITISIYKKIFGFCIFYFYEEVLIQQVCLRKYIENEIFNSTLYKTKKNKKKTKEKEQNIIQLHNYHF